MVDYGTFKKALKHLELQYANHQTLNPELPVLIQEAVTESVMQRFETCYDCLWKVLKRYLQETLGLPEVPNSPKPILRLANENNLLVTPIEQWLHYANLRVGTSHDYSYVKAARCLDKVGDFIVDSIRLYQTMSGEIWS